MVSSVEPSFRVDNADCISDPLNFRFYFRVYSTVQRAGGCRIYDYCDIYPLDKPSPRSQI